MMEHDEKHPDPDSNPESDAARIARRDDYLWDRSGEPDPTVAKLEGALAQERWRGPLGDLAEMDATVDEGYGESPGPAPGARRPLRWLPRALAAGLIFFLLTAVGLSVWHGIMEPRNGERPVGPDPVAQAPDAQPYRFEVLDGAPRIDGVSAAAGAPLEVEVGTAVETDAASRALVHVGDIGSVELGTDSRLRVGDLADAGDPEAGYLLHLDRGLLTASIFAAPRLFQLGTPSGIAVDMGCVYTAHVDEAGTTRLHVDLGQVSFETERRKVLVPSDASTRAWPGVGPGTPVWDDAPQEWREAVERYDELTLRDGTAPGIDDMPRGALLDSVLATERSEDSLTLWHLLAHASDVDGADGADGARVYERLAALAPPPEGVTREACLVGDEAALLAWRDVMGWAWTTSKTSKPPR
ncbi:MAG: FecR family protein [Planctomycetota bacterium]|jgi:hypothetical protein